MRVRRTLALVLCLLLFGPFAIGQSTAANVKPINPAFTTIDVPGAIETGVVGLNTAGVMTGFYSTDGEAIHSFLLVSGNFSFFDYPGAYSTQATGINDAGLVVGFEGDAGNIHDKGFLYDGTTFTPIKVGQNTRTMVWGVDSAGDLAGGAGSANSTRALVKQSGAFRPVNFPGPYSYAYATGINNFGQIVGWTAEGSAGDSYLFANGKFKKIDVPGSTATTAFSINDSGLVVGYYQDVAQFFSFAFYRGKFISFGYPGAVATSAYGVNNAGQVVGTYTFDYQTYHGFVTSPITSADFE
jgi:probable HAF family extracellular repeat protein